MSTNYITDLVVAEKLLETVRGVFKPRSNPDIHDGDVVARKAVCGLTHLMDENGKIEAANAYLEMAAFFLKRDENKSFYSILEVKLNERGRTDPENRVGTYDGQIVKAGRDRIMAVVRQLRKASVKA